MTLFNTHKIFRLLTLLLAILLVVSCSEEKIRLGITTTQEDSGLLNSIVEEFYQSHDISIKPIVVGSGQLFELIKRQEVDIAITHEPIGEQLLLENNYIDSRTPLFFNYFLLVGPRSDPANIVGSDSVTTAFKQLLDQEAFIVSRADNSGTHVAEEAIWKSLKRRPDEKFLIKTGTGMGHTLSVANERLAYTLVDLGTWLHFGNKQQLTVIWQPATIPQKTAAVYNQYSLLTLLPHHHKHYAHAELFREWITSNIDTIINRVNLQTSTAFFREN